jgi:hypothetical protein
MRRASTCLAVLGLAALGVPAIASGAPNVTFKATAIPIPGFPHTGNILGAGAALKTEWTIKGTEYDEGHPPPLIGVNVFFPAGTKLHPQGFSTCSEAALLAKGEEAIGTPACPKKSLITFPVSGRQPESSSIFLPNESYGVGVVRFGKEVAEEKARVQGFFAPGGGLEFFTKGVTPASFEFIAAGHVVNSSSPSIISTVPLVETVPGAADGSAEKIVIYAGAAYKQGKKPIYYGTVPKKCPKAGFPIKSELTFAGLSGLTQQTVTSIYKAPCPRR